MSAPSKNPSLNFHQAAQLQRQGNAFVGKCLELLGGMPDFFPNVVGYLMRKVNGDSYGLPA